MLAGCAAAPTRLSQPGVFKVEASGQVKPADAQAATDCIMDGFDESSSMLSAITVRQQRRVGAYRVEALNGAILLASADVHDTGKIELSVASQSTVMINMDKQRAAVSSCIEKFR